MASVFNLINVNVTNPVTHITTNHSVPPNNNPQVLFGTVCFVGGVIVWLATGDPTILLSFLTQ